MRVMTPLSSGSAGERRPRSLELVWSVVLVLVVWIGSILVPFIGHLERGLTIFGAGGDPARVGWTPWAVAGWVTALFSAGLAITVTVVYRVRRRLLRSGIACSILAIGFGVLDWYWLYPTGF